MEIRRSPGVRVLASVQPGRWVVGCLPGDVNLNDVPLTKYSAPVQVVDPKGYWPVIEDRQSCGERLPAPGPAAGTDAPLAGPLAGRFVLEFFDGEKGGIVSVNADGSDPVRLTAEGRDVDSAVWSPDGSRVAFLMQDDADGDPTVYDAALEDSEIYVMGADGGNLTRLTENRHSDDIVRWNPDGTRLSFRSNRDGDHRLYTMRTDGTDVRPLTPAGWTADSHSWSPDGSRFAFVGGDGEDDGDGCFFAGHEDLELYLMNADGSGAVRLTDDELYQQSPVWSPDGSKVAFAASNQSDYAWEIFVVNADGSGLWRLTDYPGYDMGPVWSPDGSMIGFTSDRSMGGDPHGDHQGGIPYVMNADGSGVRPLFTIDQLRSMGLAPEYDVWVEAWLS
jgi:Tol biopolymer transport system component